METVEAHEFADTLSVLTVKLPAELEAALLSASARAGITKSELMRRALTAYLARPAAKSPKASILDHAADLVGCFEGGPKDLASNPKHLEGFGRI